jgi:sugar phosphate isomerase/epimerase
MALGFSTLNHSTMFGLDTGLLEQVRAAADSGFELIALDIFSLRATIADGGLADLAALVDELGIEMLDVCALSIGRDTETWSTELAEVAAAARVLRPRHLMVRFDAPIDATRIGQVRRTAAELADAGVTLVVEPSPLSNVESLVRGRELLADMGVDGCGLVVDSWHFFVSGTPWSELAAAIPDIAYVQIADGLVADGADLMDQTLHHRRQPGDGEFDLARFVRALTDGGYRGPWCAEVLDRHERSHPVEEFAARTHRHLAALCPSG